MKLGYEQKYTETVVVLEAKIAELQSVVDALNQEMTRGPKRSGRW
jgi:hypothetical protein